jgi:hypothetical protein
MLPSSGFRAARHDSAAMNVMHAIYNKSGDTNRAMFGVAPTRRLWDLFTRIHNLTDPADVVRISVQHNVNFLPPQV